MPGIERTAVAFTRACERASVPFVIVGGFAVAAWGEPRATRDVDALVSIENSKVDEWVVALRNESLSVDARDIHDGLREGGHVTIFDDETGYHVDVKLAKTAMEREEIASGLNVDLPTGRLRVVPPEEAVAFKVLFGTPLDLQDARSILARQGASIDQAKLLSLGIKLGIVDALRKLVDDVERARKGR